MSRVAGIWNSRRVIRSGCFEESVLSDSESCFPHPEIQVPLSFCQVSTEPLLPCSNTRTCSWCSGTARKTTQIFEEVRERAARVPRGEVRLFATRASVQPHLPLDDRSLYSCTFVWYVSRADRRVDRVYQPQLPLGDWPMYSCTSV